jgi:hypothetical protein
VKVTPDTGAPLTVMDAVDGVNVYPGWLAEITYKPFDKPEKL